jgi:hypothetical protein
MPKYSSEIDKNFDLLYDDLKNYLSNLENKFLSAIPADEIDIEKYEYEIKAYCLLSHGAIEEFAERVATKAMIESVNIYMGKRVINATLLSLVGCYGKIEIDSDESCSEKKPFDYIRENINKIKKDFSKKINDNHGITIIHLRELLTPVAIYIKEDTDLKDSLKQLSKERGSYAHGGGGVKKIIGPDDAKKYVKDCRELCLDIRNKAKNIFK